MPVIELTTRIEAPIERVFDLSRSIDLHAASMTRHSEQIVDGVTTGLINLGESVTWRARHFDLWLTLTSRVTALDSPTYFRETMVRGAFKRFDHDHFFAPDGNWTFMKDVFDYTSPLGTLGIADRVFLTQYMTNLLAERNAVIKTVAESNQWKSYLPVLRDEVAMAFEETWQQDEAGYRYLKDR